METNFDVADAILKDFYWGTVFPQMITDTPLLNAIKTTDQNIVVDNVGGRQVVIPVRRGLGQGLGARARGQALPQARKQLLNKMTFPMKKIVSRVQIEGEAWRATAKKGNTAFISLLVEEIDDALMAFSKDLNQQLYGDGSGLKTTVTTGVAASPNAVDIVVGNTQWLFEDELVDIYAAGDDNPKAQGIAITNIDKDTLTVTLENCPVDIVATDEIYRNGNKDNELMGLDGLINDASGLATLQGVTVSSNAWFRSKVYDNLGTDRPLTLDLMRDLNDAAMQQDNMPPDCFVCGYDQKKAYEQLLISDQRFVKTGGKPMQMDGGSESLSYDNKPFIFDVDAQAGRIYALKKNRYVRMFQQTGYEWFSSPDKKNIWDRVTDRDSYEAVAIFEGECAVLRRNAMSRLDDLE